MQSPLVFKDKMKQASACFKAIGQYFITHGEKKSNGNTRSHVLCVLDLILIHFILFLLQVLLWGRGCSRLSINDRQILQRFILDLKSVSDSEFLMSKGIPCQI